MKPKRAIISGFAVMTGVYLFLLTEHQVSGQDSKTSKPDSAVIKRNISLERIPATAAKTQVIISQVKESLVTEEQIEAVRIADYALISEIDSLIETQKKTDLSTFNNRNLINLIDFLNEKKAEVKTSIEHLELTVKRLNDAQSTLERELQIWRNIKQRTDSISSLNLIISDLINQIKSVNEVVFMKTNEVFHLLNYTQLSELKIDSSIDSILDVIQKQRTAIFSKTHPSIFQIWYEPSSNFDIGKYLKQFYVSNISVLLHYFKIKKDIIVFYLFYLVLLMILFYYLKRNVRHKINKNPTLFEISLRKIFQLPLTAAISLGLFSVVFIFSNRPVVFNDLILLLFTIPLIKIFIAITSKSKSKYFYLLGFLIVLRMINYIFPPESVFHRLIIMIMGLTEVFVSLDMYSYFKKQRFEPDFARIITEFFVIIHLIVASAGIIGNIYGSVIMAGMAVNFVITNTLIGFLISVSVLILIGLIQAAFNSKFLKRVNVIRLYSEYLLIRISGIIIFFALLMWLWGIFRLLGINEGINSYISRLVSNPFKLGSTSFTISRIFLLFFIIWLSIVISKIVRVVLEEDILVRLPLKKGVPRMIAIISRYSLVTIGFFIAVSAAGMSLDELTIIIGAFSVGIGFGLQNIFNNLVSGMILLVERPVQIGDVVEVGPLLGQVKSMGIRSSNLRTFDGAEVIVPNGNLISNEVINWTLSDKRKRIEIISGVAYGSDIHKVQELFFKIVKDHPEVLKDPSPSVFFNNMGDSSLDFRLLFWTENFENWQRIRSEVMFRIYDVMNEEGIVIPFPQRDLHIKSIDDFQKIKGSKE